MPTIVCFFAILIIISALLRTGTYKDRFALGAAVLGCVLIILIGFNWGTMSHAITQGSFHTLAGSR